MEEILEVERQRQELLKRIQEKERLMDLIQSNHIKGGLNEIQTFQEKREQQKQQQEKELQELKEQRKKATTTTEVDKELNNIKINSFQQGISMITMVKKIQRFWRKYQFFKNKELIRDSYLKKLLNNFYAPITYERVAEIRKEIIKRLKSMRIPEGEEFEDIVNNYFNKYKEFCINFPSNQYVRENNFFIFYQCLDMLKFMENLKNEDPLVRCDQFKKFLLDRNKEFATKIKVDQMERGYKYNDDTHLYTIIDDFEENTILDEIDNRYHFEKRSDILNKRP